MNRFKLILLVLIFLAWLGPGLVLADSDPNEENTVTLDPMTVTEERERQQGIDIIDAEEIQVPRISGNILDALETAPGIQIRRSSLTGPGSGLRLRGFDETRISILQDGVFLNRDGSYGNGALDWSSLSLEAIEEIEIYRGPFPAKYGNALGGVVDFKTRAPSEEPQTSGSLYLGSQDTLTGGLSHSWKKGPLGWSVNAGHFESDGYLRNNYTDRNNLSTRLNVSLPGAWEIGAGMDHSENENGNPVYNRSDSPYYDSGYPDADADQLRGPGIASRLSTSGQTWDAWGDGSETEDENTNLTAYILKNTADGHFRLDGRLWNQESKETYFDAADRSKKIYERETDAEDNNWSLKTEFAKQIASHSLEAGAETRSYGWGDQRVTYIDTSYFNASVNSPYFTFIKEGFKGQPDLMAYHSLWAQDTWQIRTDTSLELGLRQEWFRADSVDPDAFGYTWTTGVNDMSESHLDPRLALIYRPWDKTSLTARWGIVHRYPTSPEYFWWYLNNATQYFNTDFNSERAIQYELTWDQGVGEQVDFFVRGYYYDIKDYISDVSVAGIGSVYFNIGEVTIKGVETGASWDLGHGFTTWVNLTWQKGTKADDPWDTDNNLSTELPDFPDIMVKAGVDWTMDRLKTKLWVIYVDGRDHFTGTTLEELRSYTLVNLSATYRFWEKNGLAIDLEAAAQNILDEDYEEEDGYPMPGATIMAGFRFCF